MTHSAQPGEGSWAVHAVENVATFRVVVPYHVISPTAIRSGQVQTRSDPGDGGAGAAHCSHGPGCARAT